MSKLQKKPSALKRGHPKLQNMNFYKFFSAFVGHLGPPGSGSGSTGPIEYGSNPDPDPKPCFQESSCDSVKYWLKCFDFQKNISLVSRDTVHCNMIWFEISARLSVFWSLTNKLTKAWKLGKPLTILLIMSRTFYGRIYVWRMWQPKKVWGLFQYIVSTTL